MYAAEKLDAIGAIGRAARKYIIQQGFFNSSHSQVVFFFFIEHHLSIEYYALLLFVVNITQIHVPLLAHIWICIYKRQWQEKYVPSTWKELNSLFSDPFKLYACVYMWTVVYMLDISILFFFYCEFRIGENDLFAISHLCRGAHSNDI